MRSFELRVALEGEAASLAAQRRNDDDMTTIEAAFERLNIINAEGELEVKEDIIFHAEIAAASRNQLFIQTWKPSLNTSSMA